MKFSHSLQFNSVPEWSTKYLAYSQLKKLIYSLQKDKLYSNNKHRVVQAHDGNDENLPLLADASPDDQFYISKFVAALNQELKKIDKFYISQETGLIANYNELKDDVMDLENTNKANQLFNQHQQHQSQNVVRNRKSKSQQRQRRFSSVSSTDSNPSLTDMSIDSAPIMHTQISNTMNNGNSMQNLASTSLSNSNSVYLSPFTQHRLSLKKRLISVYTQLSELKDFIELNQTGFSKICKKFDKSLNTNLKQNYLNYIKLHSHVFNPATINRIQHHISETILTYASLNKGTRRSSTTFNLDADHIDGDNNGEFQSTDEEGEGGDRQKTLDFQDAERELSSHLRDHVVWERNTVWRDMMNLERKYQSAKTDNKNFLKLSSNQLRSNANISESMAMSSGNAGIIAPSTDSLTFRELIHLPPKQWFRFVMNQSSLLQFVIITTIFIALLTFDLTPFTKDSLQKNCFAILIYASLLWATETIPLFVTSLMIPLLIVVFPVIKDPATSQPMSPRDSSQFILSTMWSSVIMLLLGGFTLAAALSKYNIAKILSTHILASAGTNPHFILLTNMFVALFVSMWVSNVAAPVLCYSIVQPLLRTLPRNCSYAKALILGIALASNIGGMSSPIASPQNIFSIGIMDPSPSWAEWFMIALPVCFICIMATWVLLIITFPPEPNVKILQLHPSRDPFTVKQWFVTLVCITTIVLWCLSNKISGIFGEMGIISIIPIVVFFGTGLLTSDDFNNFMWTIVVLAMGGSTLGKAVSSSGLLSTMAQLIKSQVEHEPIFIIVLIFGLVILVMATFVSHTVAAMIIVPLMSEIGSNLPSGDHSRLLIIIAALLCSSAMGLPTSGFPNVTAISMIDEVGDRYLTVGTFITRGVPASLLSYATIVTVGYGLLKVMGF
ncbi:pho91p [Saccharomyces arboricola H-6]|uniref:Pho91p n=1 Tax=Saccharomyces arboricola (strain H-6 / AS 2.3317 / CBS 10644) TaxID=1160507 RepID=J8PZQ2_SACAR|nr:pho91p [Saccharomyces arboricola H-6]